MYSEQALFFFLSSLSPENYYFNTTVEQRQTQARDRARRLLTHIYGILFFTCLLLT